MIYISSKDNGYIIRSEQNDLSFIERTQLTHFGFTTGLDGDDLTFLCDINDISIIRKVITYLSKINREFLVNRVLQDKLDHADRLRADFGRRKANAKEFKNNPSDYKEFFTFSNKAFGLSRSLKPHQLQTAFHSYLLGNMADFSVPGSGKTASTVFVYDLLAKEDQVNKLFVVGPPSCFTAWRKEFQATLGRVPNSIILPKLKRDERITRYYTSLTEELLLISYNTFANDLEHIISYFSNPLNKIFLAVDEAHYIKQLGGVWSGALLHVGPYAKRIQVLTGTPAPNKYTDLFNLFDLLWGEDIAITKTDKYRIVHYEKADDRDSAKEILINSLYPLFYRVKKADLHLLPPVFHPAIQVEMGPIERQIYDAVFLRLSTLARFSDTKNFRNILSLKRGRITRLRQAVSYPKLLRNALVDYSDEIDMSDLGSLIREYDSLEITSKFIKLLSLIKEIRKNDKKVLVWSHFIGTILYIEAQLSIQGYGVKHIFGEVPVTAGDDPEIETREMIIDEFLDLNSNVDILIANPAACAESISLHRSCYHAIYYDFSYNCGQFLQSLDRIHRVGGSEHRIANYYFLEYSETIDQDIRESVSEKTSKMLGLIECDSDIFDIGFDQSIDDEIAAFDRVFAKNET